MQSGTRINIAVEAIAQIQPRSRYPANAAEIATATSKGTTKISVTSSVPAKFRSASREKDSVLTGFMSTVIP
jgi:hypothetical protein